MMGSGHKKGHKSHPGRQDGGGGQGHGGQGQTISAIHAPYNFVPLHEEVFVPDWAGEVSHDRPLADGLSGELDLVIVAETPILVGNERVQGRDGVGEVHFHKAPDGRFMIPGSSLRGMVRNVLEIAAFGRMRFVDDRHLSVRDLTPGARAIYGDRMTRRCGTKSGKVWDRKEKRYVEKHNVPVFSSKARAGWIVRRGKKIFLIPCRYARIQHDELDRHVQGRMKDADTAMEKYQRWEQAGNSLMRRFRVEREKAHLHKRSGMYLKYALAHLDENGDTEGMLVFTGQPSPKKHLEFVFHSPGNAFDVPEDVWRAFRQVHEESKEWKYWRTAFQQGRKVPVFYLEENGKIQAMGLAMMFRLPYRHSIHDAVKHTTPDHLADRGDDLPALLFGYADPDEGRESLKGRAWFSPAFAEGSPREQAQRPTVLNGPKPSYYPNYIQQSEHAQRHGRLGENERYRTLMDKDCRIRGFKRYPARPEARVQPLLPDQQSNKSVQTRLYPLPRGTRFTGRLVFHNLKPEELGALVWALTWGGNKKLRHSIGMGRPFGFGQVRIRIERHELRPNDPDGGVPSLEECMARFEAAMERWKEGWKHTPQLRNLLAMADPEQARCAPGGKLAHMRLSGNLRINEFVEAKKQKLVLRDYAVATGQGASNGAQGKSPVPGGGAGRKKGKPPASSSGAREQKKPGFSQDDLEAALDRLARSGKFRVRKK